MLEFLPQRVRFSLQKVNINEIYEIRIRANKPIFVNHLGKYRYLGEFGWTERREKALVATMEDVADCIYKAGEYSVYSVEEEMKKGFITARCGERIGIAGEYVFSGGQALTIREITSLCIRVPHEVKGSGSEIYRRCMSDRVQNLLLMSPPGLGKTTILRDLGRILSEKTGKNLLICDERGEISVGEWGDTSDIIRFCDKATAFESGIRAMRPDIIITDELSFHDCAALEKAVAAGLVVIASAHFADISAVKPPFLGLFQRFVLLDRQRVGQIKGIYDEEGKELC